MSASTPTPEAVPLARVVEQRVQQAWLAILFFLGLGYIVLIAPFQAVDEVAHWDRTWSVAQGQYNCRMIPLAAAQFVGKSFLFDSHGDRSQQVPVPWSLFKTMWEHTGDPGEFWIATNGCHYPPLGYLPAALAVRLLTPGDLAEPRPHKSFIAHYGSRLANWIAFFACLIGALRISRYPMPLLAFASIPMVVHQSVSINNDAFTWGCALLAFALLTRPPTRKRVWLAIALVTAVSAIKPIHVIAATVIWIVLWRGYHARRWGRAEGFGIALAALVIPAVAWLVWNQTMSLPILGATTGMPVLNVDDAAQSAQLKADPMRVLSVLRWQLEQLFMATPINGGWRGALLALGWYRYEAPLHVYVLSLGSLLAGVASLRLPSARQRDELPSDVRVPLVFWLAPHGATFVYFAVVTLILYVAFTPVGAEMVFGVQCRYFLYPLLMLLFVWTMAGERRPLRFVPARRVAALSCLLLGLAAHVAAIVAIRELFWVQ